MYYFISKEIILEQYTVMKEEPVLLAQEGCDMTKFI